MQILSADRPSIRKLGGKALLQLREKGVRVIPNPEAQVVEFEAEDPYVELKAKDVLQALLLGPADAKFQQETVLLLFSEDFVLKIIDLSEHLRTKEGLDRILARVIGAGGSTKKVMEQITECSITITGDKIMLIGPVEGVELASEALSQLIAGVPHKKVYRLLEAGRRRVKEAKMRLWRE
ncbi:MAG: KH domain-containing protein [Candidatus Micrarchaeota archaeon]|nr:KH domain-containing protein [Candidatus Micrarchaeota archaeon]